MKINKIIPELVVKNIKESVDFYVKILGFELVDSVGCDNMVWAYVIWKNSEIGFMFMTPESIGEEIEELKDKEIGASIVQYIEIEGITELYEKIKGKTEIVFDLHSTFYGSKEFSIKDNSGYILMFAEKI